MNITELAVGKSPRTIDTVTAVASSTATESLPCSSAEMPSRMYLIEWQMASAVVTGSGKKSFEITRRITVHESLSSNSRLSARVVWSGTRPIVSAVSNENAASARTSAARSAR